VPRIFYTSLAVALWIIAISSAVSAVCSVVETFQ
jgi:hypothetical protein